MADETETEGGHAADEAAADDFVNGSWTYALQFKNIRAHGDQIGELTFRAPTGADMIAVGNPVLWDPSGDIEFDTRKLANMMSRLASVPTSAISEMDPRDTMTVAWMLARFFVPSFGRK